MTGGPSTPRAGVTAAFVTLLLALATSPAATAGEEGGLTARSPVVVEGRAEALVVDEGVLRLTGDSSDLVSLLLTAPVLRLTEETHSETCLIAPGTGDLLCTPDPQERPSRAATLEDATVTTASGPRADLLLGFSVRAKHVTEYAEAAPGSLALSHADGGALVAAGEVATHAPFPGSWSPAAERVSVERGEVAYVAEDVESRAAGRLFAVIQGIDVTVTARDASGGETTTTYSTGTTTTPDQNPLIMKRTTTTLLIETPAASMRAVHSGAAVLGGMPEVTARDAVALEDARGVVRAEGRDVTHDGRDVRLEGGHVLTAFASERDRDSDGYRLVLGVATLGAALAPHAAEDEPPAEFESVASGVAVLGALAVLGGAAWYWPTLRFGATALLLPLYSRIERDEVLGHDKREEIYGLIRDAPGIHAHEISSKANIGWGTTVYHLRLLEQHHLVVSKRAGRYKRFFLTSGLAGTKKDAYGVLRNDTGARVGQFIIKNPGASQKDVCAALGLTPSLVSWHVDRLEEADLVKKVKDGRRVRYFAGPGWNDINLAVVPAFAGGLAGGVAGSASVAVVDGPRDN